MPTEPSLRIAENIAAVQARMSAAVERAGRDESDVRLIAVTKYARLEWIRELIGLGICSLGESRPQQLVQRAAAFDQPLDWHFIGHLQRNKVQLVLPHASLIHSVDSLRLLQRVNHLAKDTGIVPRVLLEVNVSGEPTKDGFTPETLSREWPQLIASRPGEISGLMTMAPASDNPADARPYFAELRTLRDRLLKLSPPELTLHELSMGMSGDFEVAIEEGATLIRVGSALFEGLSAG